MSMWGGIQLAQWTPNGLLACSCGGNTSSPKSVTYKTFGNNDAVDWNTRNADAWGALTGVSGVAIGTFVPGGKIINSSVSAAWVTLGLTNGPPKVYPGDVFQSAVQNHGDHFAVQKSIYDKDGNLRVLGGINEKCE